MSGQLSISGSLIARNNLPKHIREFVTEKSLVNTWNKLIHAAVDI